MAIIYILPTYSSSPYGVSTDKNKKKLTFKGAGDSAISDTKEITVQYGQRKNFNNAQFETSVPIDTSKKKYNVFSDEKIDNPYYNKPQDLPTNWANSGVEQSEKIDEQTYYEIKHKVKPGTYDTQIINIKSPTLERTKFMNFRVSFKADGVTMLNTDNPDDELIYLIIKQSSKSYNSIFATSLQEFLTKNINALFYIADVEVEREAALKYQKAQIKLSAYIDNIIENFSEEKIHKLATVLNIVEGKLSKLATEERLIEFISSPTISEAQKDKFRKYYKMSTEANLADDFEREYLIQDCVNYKILISTPDGYFWPSQKGSNRYEIAKTSERLNKYLKDSKNKEVYEMLKDELANKAK